MEGPPSNILGVLVLVHWRETRAFVHRVLRGPFLGEDLGGSSAPYAEPTHSLYFVRFLNLFGVSYRYRLALLRASIFLVLALSLTPRLGGPRASSF